MDSWVDIFLCFSGQKKAFFDRKGHEFASFLTERGSSFSNRKQQTGICNLGGYITRKPLIGAGKLYNTGGLRGQFNSIQLE